MGHIDPSSSSNEAENCGQPVSLLILLPNWLHFAENLEQYPLSESPKPTQIKLRGTLLTSTTRTSFTDFNDHRTLNYGRYGSYPPPRMWGSQI